MQRRHLVLGGLVVLALGVVFLALRDSAVSSSISFTSTRGAGRAAVGDDRSGGVGAVMGGRATVSAEQARKGASLQAWLKEYSRSQARIHAHFAAGGRPDAAHPLRVLKCHLRNGYGNVVRGALTCAHAALVRNRTLYYSREMAYFMNRADDEHWPFVNGPEGNLGYDMYWENAPEVVKNANASRAAHLLEDQEGGAELLVGKPIFYTSPFLGRGVDLSYFPVHWPQILLHHVFELKPEYHLNATVFMKENYASYNIGVQVRVKLRGDGNDKTPLPDDFTFFQAAETLSLQAPVEYCDVAWIVSSLDGGFTQWLRDWRHANHPECPSGTARVLSPPFLPVGGHEGSKKAVAAQKLATLTWLLLSQCDDVITTGGSSFAETAATYGGIMPVICTYHQVCGRKLTTEPQAGGHYWWNWKPRNPRRDAVIAAEPGAPRMRPGVAYDAVDSFAQVSEHVWWAHRSALKAGGTADPNELRKLFPPVIDPAPGHVVDDGVHRVPPVAQKKS